LSFRIVCYCGGKIAGGACGKTAGGGDGNRQGTSAGAATCDGQGGKRHDNGPQRCSIHSRVSPRFGFRTIFASGPLIEKFLGSKERTNAAREIRRLAGEFPLDNKAGPMSRTNNPGEIYHDSEGGRLANKSEFCQALKGSWASEGDTVRSDFLTTGQSQAVIGVFVVLPARPGL
jgi:uncharacterized protein YcfJ